MITISVPVYRRQLSNTEYIWKVRKLSIRVGEIVANKPKKYKGIYSDKIVNLSLDALASTISANEIYVSTTLDYENRRACLLKAKGDILSMLCIVDIFLEQIKKSPVDSIESKLKRDSKIEKQQIELDNLVNECIALISGVLKSDSIRYKNLIK